MAFRLTSTSLSDRPRNSLNNSQDENATAASPTAGQTKSISRFIDSAGSRDYPTSPARASRQDQGASPPRGAVTRSPHGARRDESARKASHSPHWSGPAQPPS